MAEIKIKKTGKFAVCHPNEEVEGGDIYFFTMYSAKKIYEGSHNRCKQFMEKKGLNNKEYVVVENFDGNTKRLEKEDFIKFKKGLIE